MPVAGQDSRLHAVMSLGGDKAGADDWGAVAKRKGAMPDLASPA